MNFKLRLQNKATLISIAGLIVSTIYQILGLLGIVPSISEDMVTHVLRQYLKRLTTRIVMCYGQIIVIRKTKKIGCDLVWVKENFLWN